MLSSSLRSSHSLSSFRLPALVGPRFRISCYRSKRFNNNIMSSLSPVPDPTASTVPASPPLIHEQGATAAVAAGTDVTEISNLPPSEAVAGKGGEVGSPLSGAAVPSALPGAKASKKKKKSQVTVTMATAPVCQAGGAAGENTGRWTAEEHRLFLQGLEQHGKGWKKIASLIKSRTVVQIRTHAQKYFQKLSKARQNGEEGEISMEGRGGPLSLPSIVPTAAQTNKRRRQTSGTKRKAIQSVVASAQRQGKRMAAARAAVGQTKPKSPLSTVAPVLQPFVLPHLPAPTTAQPSSPEALSAALLEDSLFRFLSPVPVAPETQVNEVARQAGANPITLPSEHSIYFPAGGEISPTGVADFALYPSWTDAKDTPSWYAKGSDVDALLDVADTLDWLTDTGDLNETYPPANNALMEMEHDMPNLTADKAPSTLSHAPSANNLSLNTLPRVDSHTGVDVPPLPSLFGVDEDADIRSCRLSVQHLAPCASSNTIDEHLKVFDSDQHDLEHDFVSSMLDNGGVSCSDNLADLQ